MKKFNVFTNGIIRENPVWVLLLGMCPALGTTFSAVSGLAMGLATAFVLVCSNLVISSCKGLIPDRVRIPAFFVLIATFVTIVQMVMEAYAPALFDSLGLFIPLIVVNCIVLMRAETVAAKNGVFVSLLDGLGMGLGFTLALTLLGVVRELLGTGRAFGYVLYPENYGSLLFVLAPGAFIALGFLIAVFNKFRAAHSSESSQN